MAGTSQHTASHVLNWLIGGAVAFSPAGTLYVALTAAAPDPTGDGVIVEPNPATEYIHYARLAVVSSAGNWPVRTDGTIRNGVSLAFPTSGGGASSPVALTNVVLIDSPSGSGLVYAVAPLPGGTVVANGDTPDFATGLLAFVLA